jgi:hypothetical protein
VAAQGSAQVHTVDLDLHPNEASDLLPLDNDDVLASRGWDRGFWTVLDEGAVERCVALIGHRRGPDEDADSWEVARPRFRPAKNGDATEDAEACARHDGWIYLVGSHYGGKSGPIEGKRAFLARFRESDIGGDVDSCEPPMEIAMNKLRLHRAVNDALGAFGPALLGPGRKVRKRFVKAKPDGVGKRARRRVHPDDAPINIEGATFGEDGSLILGLRYPVTREGHPILVELAGVQRMFEDRRAAPVARRFWVLENVGGAEEPAGIRALHREGRRVHAIVGSLDATDKGSTLLEDIPEGGLAACSHQAFRLTGTGGVTNLRAEHVQDFDLRNVEGLAAGSGGRFFYVTDEDDRVHIRLMRREVARRATRAAAEKDAALSGDGQNAPPRKGSSRSART